MKQMKKILSVMILSILTTGIINNGAKASSLDDLYKAAYDSMIVAKKERNQTSINKARAAINSLPKNMISSIGTLSSEVDKVQQPIFVKIVDLIVDAKKVPTQDKINQGRVLLEGVEPAYANSWSSALDEVQNEMIKKVTGVINGNLYEKKKGADRNSIAIMDESVKALLDELRMSTNKDVLNYIEVLNNMYNKSEYINIPNNTMTNSGTDLVALPNNYNFNYEQDLEDKVLVLVNQFRKDNGLNPLTMNEQLRQSSRYKSNSMLQLNYIGHGNVQYGNKNSMFLMKDIFKINANYYAENLLNNFDFKKATAQEMFESWKNSPGHRANMLSGKSSQIGIGIVVSTCDVNVEGENIGKTYNVYATQHFID